MSSEPSQYQVVIAGGGPAGLAAGLFTARYALSTLILDRGKSWLKQCAYLDNYLGFPGGVDALEFLDLARAHASEAGCHIVTERVAALELGHETARFIVRTRAGDLFLADRFVAATSGDVEYLRALNRQWFDDDGQWSYEPLDAYGRTNVEGLYLAGVLAGVENQAIISAGQAAQAALGLIQDVRYAEGNRDAVARWLDWQVHQGQYEGERWAERVRAYFRASMSEQLDLDSADVHQMVERWIARKRDQQLDHQDVERRRALGRRMRAQYARPLACEDSDGEVRS